MSDSVDRFYFDHGDYGDACITHTSDGDWVAYEDYAKLEQRNKELETERRLLLTAVSCAKNFTSHYDIDGITHTNHKRRYMEMEASLMEVFKAQVLAEMRKPASTEGEGQ